MSNYYQGVGMIDTDTEDKLVSAFLHGQSIGVWDADMRELNFPLLLQLETFRNSWGDRNENPIPDTEKSSVKLKSVFD